MLALNFLRVALAWAMHVGIQMPGVGAPMIRVVAGQPEGLEGSVSKVDMETPIPLIYKTLFSSISTFETPSSIVPYPLSL
jgi:hypothetical protein